MNQYKLVVKSNDLIEKPSDLTLQCQKAILTIISLINNKKGVIQPYYYITYKELSMFLGITKSNSYKKQIETVLTKLNSKPLWLSPVEFTYWISAVKYEDNGLIRLELPKTLTKYLIKLKKNFTSYRLYNVLPMNSSRTIRLYELLKQFEALGERLISLDQFKYMLGLKEGTYLDWSDLKKRILVPAKKDLKENSDLKFEFYPISKGNGKKITHVHFYIFKQQVPETNWAIQVESMQSIGKPKQRKVPIKNRKYNTDNYNSVYTNFHENKLKYPDNYTFNQYVQERNFSIIENETNKKGKDLVADLLFN